MASESAISVSMFTVMPRKYMTMNEEMTETGSVRPVMTVDRHELRKRNTMKTVRIAPRTSVILTSETASRMNTEESRTTWISTPGSRGFSSSIAARIPSTTATTFAFVCLVMSMATAGSPSMSASERCSSTPSRTSATSESRIGSAPRRLMTMDRKPSTLAGLPEMRSGISVRPWVRRPSGVLTFSDAMPPTTSSMPIPSAERRAGSTSTVTSRFVAPTSLARATPVMFSRRRLIVRSASAVRSRGAIVVDRTASDMIGIAWKSNFWMTGSLMPAGRSRRIALIFARASCETSLILTSSSNSTTTVEKPSREIDWTCLTPAIGLTASSIFRLTSRSTASGEAPGYSAMIERTGISTDGISSIGSRRAENNPSVTRVSIITVATTGRLMERLERNIATPPRPSRSRSGRPAGARTRRA